jgi:hypothetical protein
MDAGGRGRTKVQAQQITPGIDKTRNSLEMIDYARRDLNPQPMVSKTIALSN